MAIAGLAAKGGGTNFTRDPGTYFWAIFGGYWSHLWIDMLNIRGVDLLWPSPIRVVMPSRIGYRMEVGSKAEMVLMTALFVACLALYPVSKMGVRGGLHQVLKNFDMAVDEYKARAGTSWFKLELAAIDNLTLEHIRCTCPVLGAWQDGLIVEYQGHSRAVGKSQLHNNLYPTEAVLLEGEPLTIQTQRVDMKGRSLQWLMEALQGKPNVYLLGELWIDADKVPAVTEIDLYHPVGWSGEAALRPGRGFTRVPTAGGDPGGGHGPGLGTGCGAGVGAGRG